MRADHRCKCIAGRLVAGINIYNRPRMSFGIERIVLLYKEGRVDACALRERWRVIGWVLCVKWLE